jgi:Putative beta barrel porin-7 (BBP7)
MKWGGGMGCLAVALLLAANATGGGPVLVGDDNALRLPVAAPPPRPGIGPAAPWANVQAPWALPEDPAAGPVAPPGGPWAKLPGPGVLPEQGGAAACPPPLPDSAPDRWLRIEAEALLWWVKGDPVPPLLTTSPQGSLGVLGRPGTQVLFGGKDEADGERPGARFTAAVWLDECDTGVEATFFFLTRRSADYRAGSTGDPLLARPIVNLATGGEDAQLVAVAPNPAVPNLLPTSGQFAASYESSLWGLELNGVRNLSAGYGQRLDALGGVRFLTLGERLDVAESLVISPAAVEGPLTRIQVRDDFHTGNEFYGPQAGLRAVWLCQRWSFLVEGKLSLGLVHETADVQGNTATAGSGSGPAVFSGGLLAQPSNLGNYTRDRFAVLPEVGVKVGYRLAPWLRATVGYDFLYLSSAVRQGEQINRLVDARQLPPAPPAPSVPTFPFRSTDFWAQGLDFGLEFSF